jgi:hypothetical protein
MKQTPQPYTHNKGQTTEMVGDYQRLGEIEEYVVPIIKVENASNTLL